MYFPIVGWITKVYWIVPVSLFLVDIIVISFHTMGPGGAVDVLRSKSASSDQIWLR